MNDITIMKSISKVHSIIIDFLILIFITLFSFYWTLHIGLKLDNVILPGVKIEQLYIKWDEKVVVDIGTIEITKSNTGNNFDFSSLDALDILEKAQVLDTVFSEVTINKITFNDLNATFSYKENHPGYIDIHSPSLIVDANIDMNRHLILVDVDTFNEKSTRTDCNGSILADLQEHKLYTNLDLNVSGIISLHLVVEANQTDAKIFAIPNAPVTKSLDPVIKLAHLPAVVEPWVADYLEGDTLYIDYISTTYHYKEPLSILDSLETKAHYTNVSYIFAPGYAPAKAPKVDLDFKNRMLSIYPRNGTFYGQPGGKTWAKIDFTKPEDPLLSVDVDTEAKLTQNLVNWLEGYGIALPFCQTQGKTKVKLALWIALEEIEVSAKGGFSTQKAVFNFSDTDIAVKNVEVTLKDTDVDIKKLNASLLKNTINVNLTGRFNPVYEKGRFDISVNRLKLGSDNSLFTIDQSRSKLKFSYILQPKSDRLIIPQSHWYFNDKPISVAPFVAPFRFSTLAGQLPTTLVTLDNRAKAYLSGTFNIKTLSTNLDIDLLGFKKGMLQLDQTLVPLKVSYKDQLNIETKVTSNWKYEDTKFSLKPSKISLKNGIVDIYKAHFSINDLLDSQLKGSYDTNDGSGKLILMKLHAEVDNTKLLNINKDVKIYLKSDENTQLLEVPIFNLKFMLHDEGWQMGIKNIHLLSTYSPLLQEYNITKGSIQLHANKKGIKIYGVIPYPYPILRVNDKPLKKVRFSGTYKDDKLNLFLNNDIEMTLTEEMLKVNAENVGVSLYPIFDFIKDHESTSKHNDKPSNFRIDIEATNSYLYINNVRRAPADKLLMQYTEGRLNAQLLYGKNGGAALEFNEKKELFVYGDHLNDKFMTQLAEFSDFKGGEASFYLTGKVEELRGIIRVQNTIIKDYKAMNNILAFMNTIPALVTFSVPDYSSKGMRIDEGYAAFVYKNDIMYINGFHITGPELRFNGKGTINVDTKTVDVETSLITDATSNLSKIPLLGYILVGKEEDTMTTTITVKGPMDNPVIKNTLAKDIGVGTFNILFRTLTFPIHYIDKAQKSIKEIETKKSKKKKKTQNPK